MSLARRIGALFASATSNIDAAAGGAPVGVVLPYAGTAAPSGWLLCHGQEVLRTTYAALDAVLGTTYGAYTNGSGGAGTTHLRLPDLRGRVVGGKDDMGGSAASRLNIVLTGTKASTSNGVITGLSSTAALALGMKAFGTGIGAGAVISSIDSASQVTLSVNSASTGSTSIRFGLVDGATLGDAGGSQTHVLATPQLPSHGHTGTSSSAGSHQHTGGASSGAGGLGGFVMYPNPEPSYTNSSSPPQTSSPITQAAGAHTHTLTIDNAGGGQAHSNLQPTLVLNYIIKT